MAFLACRVGRPAWSAPAVGPGDFRRRLLLLVALDRAGGAHRGGIGVGAGGAAGPALAEEVPALVERDLERLQPRLGVGIGTVGGDPLVELVLLVDQRSDAGDELGVVHVV